MTEIKMSRVQKIVVGLLCLGVMLRPSGYMLYLGLTENSQNEYIDPDGRIVDWVNILILALPPLLVGIPLAVLILVICLLVIYLANRLREA